MPGVADLVEKYKSQLKKNLSIQTGAEEVVAKPITTEEYGEFKKHFMPPELNFYEKMCNQAEKLLKIKPDPKKEEQFEEAIRICHLNTTPSGIASFAVLAPVVIALGGAVISLALLGSSFFAMIFLIFGALLFGPLNQLPLLIANDWRMRASNQMIICIFYVVTYMRHTSNLEIAINFASDHLDPPLSLDLKKVIWDVETQKYPSIKDSLDAYLDSWKKYSLEFVEAFHLIEGSLFEGNEERRVSLLDKSLTVILEETYEKMLHYAQELKSPVTTLHMLGVILPVLGLVILPLVVSFMQNVKWYYLASFYNIFLPLGVYYFGRSILSTRPGGYGEADISNNPDVRKKSGMISLFGMDVRIEPKTVGLIFAIVLLVIGLSPIWIHLISPTIDFDILKDPITKEAKFKFLEYRESKTIAGLEVGPFGLGATMISLLLPLGVGLGLGLYYKLRSQNIIKIREQTKRLEAEFASSLFQLGNRLADGIPAEIAFGRVAETIEGTASGDFFKSVDNNIRNMGMGVEQAIFDSKVGAIWKVPSKLIESSMKVLVESARKGPRIAAQAMINISSYVKEIHRVDERLKDLLADIISGTKSQIKMMAPVISAIVMGITSMITTILGKLGAQMKTVSQEGSTGVPAADVSSMFGDGLPAFYFQFIVGFYVVEIVYILTVLNNTIENGTDKLKERYDLGVNLTNSTLMYCVLAGIVILLFNLLAVSILASKVGTS